MGVVVRTSLIALAIVARGARADSVDSEIIGSDPGWRVEDIQLRTTYLDQDGHGFQSQDGALPGSEQMRVIQPSVFVTVRQSDRVVHKIALPIDAITAASPDAVDATTSASRSNVAGDLDLRTSITLTEHDTLTTRFVAHAEEWLGGGTIGAGWKRSLADDNATIAVSGTFGIDVFDDHDHLGSFLGKTSRSTGSLSVAGSQLLSPTTVVDASYGLTYQSGYLRTGWNSVPIDTGMLTDEIFPDDRVRHSLIAGLAQHVPQTHSTVKARYRFYFDDFGLRAHTIDASVYQYLVSWMYVRGGYRFYDQNGVDFFTTEVASGFTEDTLRTSDSDLAPFHAHEFSVQVATVRGRGPLDKWSLSAELFRYARSNDLTITAFSLGFGRML
ncbi:MAG: DUF3570 domain-containing protein [Kofleriaceae bacterium]